MKILIISPTPTHPTNAGNRLRILSFCELLKIKGFEVHFLFIENEEGDKKLMADYFNNNLHVFNSKDYIRSKGILDKCKHFLSRKRTRFIKKFKAKFASDTDGKYNFKLDYYYDNFIDTFIEEEGLDKKGFTHVLVEYVVFSKALDNFENTTVKVIDLHDSLASRYKIYLANDAKPEFYSLFEAEEAKGLNRAHHVIAIQQDEKEYFRSNCSCNVEVIGHFTEVQQIKPSSGKNILFVGSQNKINLDGLNHFITNIFPKVLQADPAVKLLIAGNICDREENITSHDGVELLGRYDDPADVYDKSTVVIIPLTYGTGLKIKTIEALAYGKAVVTFEEGLRGLPKPGKSNDYCILAEDDASFAEAVLYLLKDDAIRHAMEIDANSFIERYNIKSTEAFDKVFS